MFGVTEKWARAFEALGELPLDEMGWYVSARPFVYAEFAHSLDGFAVTTSGVIASTPGRLGGERVRRRRLLRRRRRRRGRGVLVGSRTPSGADRFEPTVDIVFSEDPRDFARRDWSALVTADPSGTSSTPRST